MILVDEDQIEKFTNQGWWGTKTIYDVFRETANQVPSKEALVDAPNKQVLTGLLPLRYTYGDMVQRIDWLATSFIELGIKNGDVIIIQLPNIVEIIMCYLAAARIGAIVSPLAMQYRTHELRHMLSLVEPKAYIATTNFNGFNTVEMVQNVKSEFLGLTHVIGIGDDIPDSVLAFDTMLNTPRDTDMLEEYLVNSPVSADDCFTICWTSGTENVPKGVPRSHNQWVAIGRYCTEACAVQPGYNVMIDFPMINMSSIGGLWLPWLLRGGGKLVMHHPFDLKVMLGQIQDEQINYTLIPPAVLNMLLQNEALMKIYDFGSMKSIGSGSAPLSPWMVRGFQEKYSIYIHNIFGGNEGVTLVSNAQEFSDPDVRAIYFPRWGVPGYKASIPIAESLQTKIVDPSTKREITEPGTPGDLYIKGPAVFGGYYKRPDLTKNAFDGEGFFNTGDLFSIESDQKGNLIYYLFHGRSKDLIIRGGFNVSPEEVENLLLEHPKIAEVAVVGYPDPVMGEKGCACVVLKPDETLTLEDISEFLIRKDCAVYKRPEKLLVLEEMPRNAVNKVLKRELRQLVLEDD